MPHTRLALPEYLILEPVPCQYCHNTDIVGHGDIEVLIKGLPIRGKQGGIYVIARRFRFLAEACRKSFTEPLPATHETRCMTNRLLPWIG